MAKAYSYLRFSTPEQMLGDSFRRQTQLAVDYCKQHGLTLDTEVTYSDLGVSAFRGKNAEAGRLGEFLEAVREGLVERESFLLVESLDRISRQAARKALRILEAICDEGITVVTLSDNKTYTREALDTDPMSLIMSLLIFIRANEESAMKSRRIKAAWVGKRQKIASEGKMATSKGPGWLRLDKATNAWVVIPERAKVIQRVFKDALGGTGPHTIAERLNSERVPVFGAGKMWHRSYIVKLLFQSPSVIGTYVPHVLDFENGKRVRKPLDPIESYYPPVVDQKVYQQVRSIKDGMEKHPSSSSKVHNIFAGMVRCGRCGGSMNLQNKGKPPRGARYFVCTNARYGNGCKYTAVRYDEIEGFFLAESKRILDTAPTKDVDGERQLATLEASIEALQDRHGPLVEGYEKTHDMALLDRLNEVNEELVELKERRGELQARVDAAASGFVTKRSRELSGLLKAGAAKLDRVSTSKAVRAIFSGLSINPDTGEATLGWRHGGSSQFTFGWPEGAKETA